MASYPELIKSFTTKVDNVNDAVAEDVNALQDEVMAIEAVLGTLPSGTAGVLADLRGRMSDAEAGVTDADGRLDAAEGTLTNHGGRLSSAEGNLTTAMSEINAVEGRLDALEMGGDVAAREKALGLMLDGGFKCWQIHTEVNKFVFAGDESVARYGQLDSLGFVSVMLDSYEDTLGSLTFDGTQEIFDYGTLWHTNAPTALKLSWTADAGANLAGYDCHYMTFVVEKPEDLIGNDDFVFSMYFKHNQSAALMLGCAAFDGSVCVNGGQGAVYVPTTAIQSVPVGSGFTRLSWHFNAPVWSASGKMVICVFVNWADMVSVEMLGQAYESPVGQDTIAELVLTFEKAQIDLGTTAKTWRNYDVDEVLATQYKRLWTSKPNRLLMNDTSDASKAKVIIKTAGGTSWFGDAFVATPVDWQRVVRGTSFWNPWGSGTLRNLTAGTNVQTGVTVQQAVSGVQAGGLYVKPYNPGTYPMVAGNDYGFHALVDTRELDGLLIVAVE